MYMRETIQNDLKKIKSLFRHMDFHLINIKEKSCLTKKANCDMFPEIEQD